VEKQSGFDQKTKKPIEQTYKYSDLVSKTMVLGNYTLFSDISDDRSYVKVLSDGNAELLDNVFYDEWVKKYCLQQTFSITLQGHEKRCCGKMLNIQWCQEGEIKGKNATESDVQNEKYTGGFLIKSVTHYFRTGLSAYYQKLSLIKNGYQNLETKSQECVMKQEDQRYRNSFDDNSFTNYDWNKASTTSSEGLFNRQSSPEDYTSGLLQAETNAVDTKNPMQKLWGWITGD